MRQPVSSCVTRPAYRQSGASVSALPSPSDQERAQSELLLTAIQKQIQAHNGELPFDQFMHMALYQPGLGYYASGREKFGEPGDFVTAPELGPVFGRCLARQIQQVLALSDGDSVLEFGAGSGALAVTVLSELAVLDALPTRYLILEASGALRARQQAAIAELDPAIAERVQWLDGLPAQPINGCIIANEVLDAMPVVRFRVSDAGLEEMVVRDQNGELATGFNPPGSALQRHWDSQLGGLINAAPGRTYLSEFNPAIGGWFRALADSLARGAALLIDYGYPRAEYYLPERDQGTLMCHYRHRAHADPFWLPGCQDITAFVDFTACAQAAVDAGFDVNGFTTQSAFLISNGLEQLMAESDPNDEVAHLKLSNEVKTLTLPSEMGERFKVLGVSKQIDATLNGFALMDYRWRL